jgi:hypothetical protein
MKDTRQHQDYELSEEDIDKAIHILSVYDPKNATPENAIDFLEYLRLGVHELAHNNPDKLKELYQSYVNQKKGSSIGQDIG